MRAFDRDLIRGGHYGQRSCEAQQALALQLEPEANSLDFLQLVYRNGSLPLTTRMRAAIAALPFESPKLLATAIINERDFATLLDQRLKRIEQLRLIDAKPTDENGGSVDARLPPPVPDRRFRRM
jgi:hypothetical protein